MEPDIKGSKAARRKLSTIRNRILKKLDAYKDQLGSPDDSDSPYYKIIRSVHFADVTYWLTGDEVPTHQLDRLTSLVHGPLFCSDEFPRPTDRKGKALFPVLQIDTNLVNDFCHRSFDPGLVQVWAPEFVRFIPSSKVSKEFLIDGDQSTLDYSSDGLLVPHWTTDDDAAIQITGAIPVGYSCPEISQYLSEEELPKDLLDDLSGIAWGIREPEIETIYGIHLFGDFQPHQIAPWDFYPSHLFLRHVWAEVSNGLVFYAQEAGGDENFHYYDCGR